VDNKKLELTTDREKLQACFLKFSLTFLAI